MPTALARDLLYDRDGALAHERDRLGMGEDVVARGAGRGKGRAAQSEPR
jgi:hypothetical protein